MPEVKSFDIGDPLAPHFPNNYEVIDHIVLNLTNICGNNNKFYSMELQESAGDYRVFTHYGRVGACGVQEGRYFIDAQEAQKEYQRILKTKQKKGYVPVDMASSDVGSVKAMQKKIEEGPSFNVHKSSIDLDLRVQSLVEQIYEEASKTLETTIKTPLGALSTNQIDKGYEKLGQIRKAILYKDSRLLTGLSSEFYSLIPHRFYGKIDQLEVIIDTSEKADRKEELLQLMKDVYDVKDDLNSGIVAKYKAINAKIEPLEHHDNEFQRVEYYVESTQSSYHNARLNVNNVYNLELFSTKGRFNQKNLETMELFHGSANKNILGILQRGLLIAPPCAQFTGAAFGRGIYFARHSTKSAQYSTKFYSNLHDNGFLFLADVAVGRMQKVRSFTFTRPSPGFDSVMGVAGADLIHDEYIVYNVNQVELKYLIDFTPRRR